MSQRHLWLVVAVLLGGFWFVATRPDTPILSRASPFPGELPAREDLVGRIHYRMYVGGTGWIGNYRRASFLVTAFHVFSAAPHGIFGIGPRDLLSLKDVRMVSHSGAMVHAVAPIYLDGAYARGDGPMGRDCDAAAFQVEGSLRGFSMSNRILTEGEPVTVLALQGETLGSFPQTVAEVHSEYLLLAPGPQGRFTVKATSGSPIFDAGGEVVGLFTGSQGGAGGFRHVAAPMEALTRRMDPWFVTPR